MEDVLRGERGAKRGRAEARSQGSDGRKLDRVGLGRERSVRSTDGSSAKGRVVLRVENEVCDVGRGAINREEEIGIRSERGLDGGMVMFVEMDIGGLCR